MSKRPMTDEQKEITRRDFFRRAACAGVGMTAVYCAIRDLRLMNAALADVPPADGTYKALVCLFLNGGNDANNWLIPSETTSTGYTAYAAARGTLAIPQASLVPTMVLNSTVSDGHTYALHPQCQELRDLYNGVGGARRCAFVANVGTLLYPITRTQYLASPRIIPIPPQLFSHQDQVLQWMTSVPDQDSRTGWGGRIADLVNSAYNTAGSVSMSVSLAGINTFEVGDVVNEYNTNTSSPVAFDTGTINSIDMTGVNKVLTGYTSGSYISGINDIPLTPAGAAAPQFNVYERGSATMTKRANDNAAAVSSAIAISSASNYWKNTSWQFVYPRSPATNIGSSLMSQLKMVARLIAGRKILGHMRQVFFVSVGGYDLHTNLVTVLDTVAGTTDPLTGPHAKLLSEISQGVYAFQRAIDQLKDPALTTDANVRLNAGDAVTLFTISDFGRTFPFNGTWGSDHGWGNHQLVVGDQVQGGRVYGTFPTLAVNGPDDTQIGRWIPKTSVDEYSATLARWMGVGSANLNTIFPNLSRFPNPNLGFMAAVAAPSPAPQQAAPILITSAGGSTGSTPIVTSTPSSPSKPTAPPRPVIKPAPPAPPRPVIRPVARK